MISWLCIPHLFKDGCQSAINLTCQALALVGYGVAKVRPETSITFGSVHSSSSAKYSLIWAICFCRCCSIKLLWIAYRSRNQHLQNLGLLLSRTGLMLVSAHCKPKPAVQLKRHTPPPCPTRGLAANKTAPVAMKIAALDTFLITVTYHLIKKFWPAI